MERTSILTSLRRCFRHGCQLSFLVLWIMLSGSPLTAQVAGFFGVDEDRDGLPDDFEQAILDKFKPVWRISSSDCNGLPAEYTPGIPIPTVKDQNGTIYGQVFIRGSNTLGFFIEAHFYDLWAADCGYINSHLLDAEHVSVLIRAADSQQPLTEWYATLWYAAAHEDTLCDSSQFATPAIVGAEDRGATFWIARGKHGAFFSEQICRIGGCGLDRCEASSLILSPSPTNLGEVNAPLNGAVWASSSLWPLVAKMRTDFPTFSTFSALSYSLADRGGTSVTSTGSPVSTFTGYATIQSNSAAPPAAGVSIFSVRRGNVLVTEAAVPAAAPIISGRIYAEVRDQVNTGVAIANPNSEPVQVSFFFTDINGRNFGHNTVIINAKASLGRFLDEAPFNGGSLGRGTFTFNASLPISVVALRGLTNLRNEFLITTLPISPLAGVEGQLSMFPHLADGGGWTTDFVLVNPTENAIEGTLEFHGQGTLQNGAELIEVVLNGQAGNRFRYSIAPRSAWSAKTAGSGAMTRVGSARVIPDSSGLLPTGIAIFSFTRGGIVVTESGVAAAIPSSSFRMFVESSGTFGTGVPGSLQTGIAISNSANFVAELSLELADLRGAPVGSPVRLSVPARGQIAMFLNEVPGFSLLPSMFQGTLQVSSSSESISVIGLRGRYNERSDFLLATTPVIKEGASIDKDVLFPYFAEGGGYTTQFILFNAGLMPASGWLRFYSQTGTPQNLSLR